MMRQRKLHLHRLDSISNDFVRAYMFMGCAATLLCAGVLQLLATSGLGEAYRFEKWSCVALAAVFALGGWFSRVLRADAMLLITNWSAIALVCAITLTRGEGVHAVEVGFFSMLVCVAAVISSLRAALAVAAFSALWILFLGYAEVSHWVRGAQAVPEVPLLLRVVTLELLLATSLSSGWLLSLLIARHAQSVHQREERNRALFEQLPAGLYLHRDGRRLDANERARALLDGNASASSVECAAQDVPVQSEAEHALIDFAAELDGQPVGSAVDPQAIVVSTPDGGRRYLNVSAVRIEDGGLPATLSMFIDESQRHAAELDSRQSEARLASLFAASPDCILLTEFGTGGRIIMVNEGFTRLAGFRSEEVVGRSIVDLGLWCDERSLQRFADGLRDNGRVTDLVAPFATKDGTQRRLNLSANRYELQGGSYVVTFARDVTMQEQMLREHRTILASASLGIALTRNGLVSRTNDACAALFGLLPSEMAGQSMLSFFRTPTEAELAFASAFAALGRNEQVDMELEMQRRDGSVFWCRLRGRSVDVSQPIHGEVWIAEDVTERRRVAQEIVAARDAALAAARAKSAFLANTSHEIRTPLNGVIGLARLAIKAEGDPGKRMQYMQQILDSAGSLGEIMGGILDMSQIETGVLVLEEATFDLRALLESVHSTFAAVAEGRHLGCTLRIASEVPRLVHGDAVRTRQIVSNYVTNALKFTENGAIAIIASATAEGRVRIAVQDTGIGMSAEVIGSLFRPFAQADESTTRRFGGTGLGLAICRELAELMDGTVGVESEPGRGSTFWAELRLRPTAAAADARVAAAPAIVVPPAPAASPLTVPRQQHALAGKHVLVAEDNMVNMVIARAMLDDLGIRVTEAFDGRAAIAAVDAAEAAGEPIDLVLMDLQMPGLDGYEATRELRQRYGAARLPIVALTAAALTAERERAIASGMDDFLIKPIDELAFRRTLMNVLG